ncbi:uncharacterized protein K02A2.6-like [Haliotis rubra]|uniref:uncharacterized protein K02A2.6-like n=1 Tax=Haliotis rubra TaxID=36100 RepID=UPI001EE614F9|nr:uncharacterized protein K02A2.6-like [Haliotis rubra]
MDEYADVFEGLGLFPGEHSIRTNPEILPAVNAPRNVPVALRNKVKEEIERMENIGVLIKVDEPTPWVNSMVVVEKPKSNKVRICLDPKELNKAVQREHHRIPNLDDVISKLAGSKYFSKLDARSGYWQIKLTEESSMLTTFNTPYGRYRFTRMPFGLHSAQDVFQKRVDETYEGLDGVDAIADDILIYGRTLEEHNTHLRAALQRSRERGVKLNKDKCVIGVNEVTYFGHKFTSQGLMPDPVKVTAIVNMDPPANKEELLTILGMANYLAKFVPNLSDITAPLRMLTRQDAAWHWDATQDQAFSHLKTMLSCEPGPVLQYFNPEKEVTLQVDASKYGLGSVMLQEDRPVAYSSRTLTVTEQNYAQIEKELLAICFGVERNHQFLYGREFTVPSDHKPLESIMKKPLAMTPPRLQRMLLRLQKYRFEVKFKPGKQIPVADALSRHPLKETASDMEDLDTQIHMVLSSLPVSDNRLTELKEQTSEDKQMIALTQIIKAGWPNDKSSCPKIVADFWSVRDELSYGEGLILRGDRIVIPSTMRKEMLSKVHTGHMGMEKTKRRARDVLYWPGMSSQIDDLVSSCGICQENQMSNPKEPLTPHEIPSRPWQMIGTDLFQLEGCHYIIAVDYYSRFFEVTSLQDTKSYTVIQRLKGFFARHGIPEVVKSDNGPQYSSDEFKNFSKAWNFNHVTSSPGYPASNGLAEKTVQTAKRLLSKSKQDKQDPYLALLEYRNTPIDNIASPAQMSMSRRLRSILPATHKQLQSQTINCSDAKEKLLNKQLKQKLFYDQKAHALAPLKGHDVVRMQTPSGKWQPARIVQQMDTPRSYLVRTQADKVYRRNRRHLSNPIKRCMFTEEGEANHPIQPDQNQQQHHNTDHQHQHNNPCTNTADSANATHNERQPKTFTASGRPVFKPSRYDA